MSESLLINDREKNEDSYLKLEDKIEHYLPQNTERFDFPLLSLSNILKVTSTKVSESAPSLWTVSANPAASFLAESPESVTGLWNTSQELATGLWNRPHEPATGIDLRKTSKDIGSFTGLSKKSSKNKKPIYLIDPFLDIVQFSKEPDMLFDYNDFRLKNSPTEKSRWGHFTSKLKQKQKLPIRKTLRPISQKKGIDVTLSYLREHFQIPDESKLTKYILKTDFNLMDDFHNKLVTIANLSQSFLKETGVEFNGNIEYFEDDEIEDFESLSISFSVKDFDSEKCFKLTEKLVSEIAKRDPEILNYIQIEIVPYVH